MTTKENFEINVSKSVSCFLDKWLTNQMYEVAVKYSINHNSCYKKQLRSLFQTWLFINEYEVDSRPVSSLLQDLCHLATTSSGTKAVVKFSDFMLDGVC